MNEFNYHVPDELIAGCYQLAEKVSAALTRVGIPVRIDNMEPRPPGASIEIDISAGKPGVAVAWVQSPEVMEAIINGARSGLQDAPEFEFYVPVARYMGDAITGILQLLGFQARLYDDGSDAPVVVVHE